MPPRLTYSTTASSSYTVDGTATGGAVDWTPYQLETYDRTHRVYSNVVIPDDPLGAETAAYRWAAGRALEKAMELIGRELRKEPDQNKIKELL